MLAPSASWTLVLLAVDFLEVTKPLRHVKTHTVQIAPVTTHSEQQQKERSMMHQCRDCAEIAMQVPYTCWQMLGFGASNYHNLSPACQAWGLQIPLCVQTLNAMLMLTCTLLGSAGLCTGGCNHLRFIPEMLFPHQHVLHTAARDSQTCWHLRQCPHSNCTPSLTGVVFSFVSA